MEEIPVDEAFYLKAIETNYRLENWPVDDLEMFCGIYADTE